MRCPFKNCVKGEMTAYGLLVHLKHRHKHQVTFPIYLKMWLDGTFEVLDANLKPIKGSET